MEFSRSLGIGFRKSFFGGYKSSDVDEFVDEAELEISNLKQENLNLRKEIERFREEEGSIRKAIVSAQKLADSAVKEAKSQAEKINSDVNLSIKSRKLELKNLEDDVKKFKDKIIELYRKKIVDLEKNENFVTDLKKRKPIIDQSLFNFDDENIVKRDDSNFDDVSSEKGGDFESVAAGTGTNELQSENFETRKLEFGSNYSPEKEIDESPGIFAGLFKKRKIVSHK